MAVATPRTLNAAHFKSALSVRAVENELITKDDAVSLKECVKGIKELTDLGINGVPEKYVWPLSERPRLSEVCLKGQVPVIDMQGLLGKKREQVIDEIARAATEWGIFQVINHGIEPSVVENMWSAVRGFFDQPAMDRMIFYPDDTEKPVVYVTNFNQSKEKVMNWKDSLRFTYSSIMDGFNDLPTICREPAFQYCQAIRNLGDRLYAALSESFGFSSDFLHKCVGKDAFVKMSMHFYPPCPDPSLTFGMSGHSDPNLITFLLQDEVGGLQALKDGRWVSVNPLQNSFVINIADQLQILTNGKYTSVEHRVVTNSQRPRLSMATFFSPADDAMVSPLPQFVNEEHPALYKKTLYKDYVSHFYNKGLARKSSLDFANLAKVLGGREGR